MMVSHQTFRSFIKFPSLALRAGKKIPLGIKLISFVVLARYMGWGFIDPYLSIFVSRFGASYTGVGLFFSLMYFVSALTIIPLLRLANKVKAARLMEDGEMFYFLSMLLFIFAGVFGHVAFLVIAFLLAGVANSLVIVGAETYIRRHDLEKGASRAFGYYTGLAYTGWIIGVLIGAFAIDYLGFNYMFLAFLPSILFGYAVLPKIKERGLKSLLLGFVKFFHRRQDFEALALDIRKLNPRSYFFLFIAFFDGIITVFSFIFIPLFALTANVSLKNIAFLMAAMYVPLIFSFVFSQLTSRFRKMDMITMGLLIGGVAFSFLFFVIDEMWIVILAAVKSLSIAILRPAYNGMLNRLTPRRMLGEISGLNQLAMNLGFVVGPIMAGIISDSFGIKSAFIVLAVSAFALSVFSLFFRGYENVAEEAVL